MAELNRRPDRPDPSDGQPADGGDAGDRAGRSWRQGRGGAADSRQPTLKEMFDAADKMAAEYEAGRRPLDRTENLRESRESELTGLHERAAADRAELAGLARDDQRPGGHDDDGSRQTNDAERGSDHDGTDDASPPADRTPADDPKEPSDADGNQGGDGDGPNGPPPPPDGPNDGRDHPDELARLRAENAALRREAADAKAAQAEAEGKLADAKAQIKEKETWIGELKNTVLYMDRKLEKADARADEQNAKIDTLTGTVGELTGKVDQLGTMLGDALKQMKSSDQATPEAGLDRPAPGADLAETHRPEFLPAPETVRSPADKLGGRELADEVQDGDKQRPPWYHRGPQSPTLTWTSGTISTVLTAVTHYMPPGPSFAATFAGSLVGWGVTSLSWLRDRKKKQNAD